MFRKFPCKLGPRTAPRQLPNGFKSMRLIRSYATTDAEGNLLYTEVREYNGIKVQATTRV